MSNYSFENIGGGIRVVVSNEHTFGTDSFLLSYFATPKRKDKVFDLGTGCGIIPLLWYREYDTSPEKSWGIDIQEKAIAQINQTLIYSKLTTFTPVLTDLREINNHFSSGEIDLVTCNPPYKAEGAGIISTTTSDKIAKHETLCTIDDVCQAAKWLLRFGGRLCICQLIERLPDVIVSMRSHGIEPKRIRFVQNNATAAPWLVLVEGKRGSKPFLTIDPPLILKENGKTSAEMTKIYGMYGKVDA